MGYRPDLLERSLPDTSRLQDPSLPPRSIEETHEGMLHYRAGAVEGGYYQFLPFIDTYADVTRQVQQGFETGMFTEREQATSTVDIFDLTFVRHLEALTGGNVGDIALSWRPLLLHRAARHASAGTKFSIGMGPHIKTDLPYALWLSNANERYLDFDYRILVSMMIGQVAQQRSQEYLPFPDKLQEHITKQAVLQVNNNMRVDAIDDYYELKAATGDDYRTARILKRIDREGLWFSVAILYGANTALIPFEVYRRAGRRVLNDPKYGIELSNDISSSTTGTPRATELDESEF
jgi:hypothetical protein